MSGVPSILAIDQGTTGSTALIVAQDGRILGRAYSEFTQYFPQPGWVEHDAEEIWTVTRKVSREALAEALGQSWGGADDDKVSRVHMRLLASSLRMAVGHKRETKRALDEGVTEHPVSKTTDDIAGIGPFLTAALAAL